MLWLSFFSLFFYSLFGFDLSSFKSSLRFCNSPWSGYFAPEFGSIPFNAFCWFKLRPNGLHVGSTKSPIWPRHLGFCSLFNGNVGVAPSNIFPWVCKLLVVLVYCWFLASTEELYCFLGAESRGLLLSVCSNLEMHISLVCSLGSFVGSCMSDYLNKWSLTNKI